MAVMSNATRTTPTTQPTWCSKTIKRALFKDGARMGGRVANITYAGRDIGPRSDGVAIVFAVVHFNVTFAETLADA